MSGRLRAGASRRHRAPGFAMFGAMVPSSPSVVAITYTLGSAGDPPTAVTIYVAPATGASSTGLYGQALYGQATYG